ncbi:MAG: hypothetical protein NTW19_10640, partial [Planctomycetota bacterium]|nr:hypothetical protein [Planctomycetota bacterium]
MRYHGSPAGSAVTRLRLQKNGREAFQPLVSDEFNDLPTEKEGPAWKSILVDLEVGQYTVSFSPVTRWWHAIGIKAAAYLPRKVDCLYLTDEIWAEAPDDAALQKMKSTGSPTILQSAFRPAVDAESRAAAQLWRVRPISWERAGAQPRLFELSRAYWRARVDEIAKKEYADDHVPDYRSPERQVVFDDVWNMVANPVRLRRQVDALRSDVAANAQGHNWYWLHPGEFEKITGGWKRSGDTLTADWSAHEGVAEQVIKIDRGWKYHVWVRFRQIKYQETWKIEASDGEGNNAVSFTRDKLEYEPDILANSAWQKVGVVPVGDGGSIRVRISLLPVAQPATYH